LIDVEARHLQPGLLFQLAGSRKPDRFQIELDSTQGTIPIPGLQRSLAATVGDFKECSADQAKYHDGPQQEREGVSFLVPSELKISAS
jgi:hypothetical protein